MPQLINRRRVPCELFLSVLAIIVFVFAAAAPALAAPGTASEEARIWELRREIARHDDLYYRQAQPEITDFEYDRLRVELRQLEEKYPQFRDLDFARRIGDDRTGYFSTVQHVEPMLGLEKALSVADVETFHRRVAEELGREAVSYWVEPKFDGMAISLVYERGRLIRALTRGNGEEGDDVTANLLALGLAPLQLDTSEFDAPERIEIRGEIFMTYDEFGRLNRMREAAGERTFANPRNLAAGTMKLHDPREAAERRLELVCFGWGVWRPEESWPETLAEYRDRLRSWGLPVVERPMEATGLSELVEVLAALEKDAADSPFPVDGAVVKVASLDEQEALGIGPAAPRWAMALKFAPTRVGTMLRGITWQVGRTGVLTPVAELAPVELRGATISRATLHNAAAIRRLDLRIGDTVFIEKAGAVIPVVAGVDVEQRPDAAAPYRFPERCPACQGKIDGVDTLRCLNGRCSARLKRRVEHFADAIGIRGLGPSTVNVLVDSGLVKTPAGLYRLRREALLELSGVGERSADELLVEIEANRQPKWAALIYALGIPGIGQRRAEDLARAFPAAAVLVTAKEWILQAPLEAGGAGLGPETARAAAEFLREPRIAELLRELEELGVSPEMRDADGNGGSGAFTGEVVVLTGALQGWTRAEATRVLEEAGARVAGSVSGQTTLLIAGERPGGKLEQAKTLGVRVIGEAEMLERLGRD